MTDWHPLLAAVEDAPGFWRMVAQYNTTYGLIRLVKRQGELCYRAEVIKRPGEEPLLVSYESSLKRAAWAVHAKHLTFMSRPGPANGRLDIGGSHGPFVSRSEKIEG